jgi:hypothetical protein
MYLSTTPPCRPKTRAARLKYSVSCFTSTSASSDSEIDVKPSTSVNIAVMRRGEPPGASACPCATSCLMMSTGTNLLNAWRLRADSASAWLRCCISSTRLASSGRSSSSSRPMRRATRDRFSMGRVTSFDSRSEMNIATPRNAKMSSSAHSTVRCRSPSSRSSGSQLTSCHWVDGMCDVCTR